MSGRALIPIFSVGMLLACVGCEDNAFQAPPPATVTVAAPDVEDVVEYAVFTGTTTAAVSVDVRARVSGILDEVRFEPGRVVEAGDPLFLIDPEPFVAARDAEQAKAESARAELRLAETKAERIERAARDGALSEIQALEARAEADAAAAALLVAEKELAIKQLDVDYTSIMAPVSGRIERSPFSVGDLVGNSADSSLLTTIYDDMRINVYFSAPDRLYLRSIRNRGSDSEPPAVEIGTEIDDGFPIAGVINYIDPVVDEATGTIQVRAVVENKDRRLVGGLFVRIRFAARTIEDALLVPQSVIGRDQIGTHVLVVDDNSTVRRQDIVLGPVKGDRVTVSSGLSPEDRVVVRGLMKARPGSAVDPRPAAP